MEKIPCPKCGKYIKKNGYKVHITFCKGKEGEIIMEEPKEDKVAEIATVPEPVKAVGKAAKVKEDSEEEIHLDIEEEPEEEEEEESNPLMMIVISVVVIAVLIGVFLIGKRSQ